MDNRTNTDMRVRFWGVRGSIPVPGPATLHYGGNTACVEVRCGERLVILDAGSGLRELGKGLAKQDGPLDVDLLLTHCHLDHLLGLPFFGPAFLPDTAIRLWAGHLTSHERLTDILAQLMVEPLLPITPDTFRADVTYRDFPAGDTLDLGHGIRVATVRLTHPGGATGYRIAFGGRSVCYITDHEQGGGPLDPMLVRFVAGTDLLIFDATYTDVEYQRRKGWGHSTWHDGVRLADAGSVGQLALFHHAPERDDAALRTIEQEAAVLRPGTIAAREGLELRYQVGAVSDAQRQAAKA